MKRLRNELRASWEIIREQWKATRDRLKAFWTMFCDLFKDDTTVKAKPTDPNEFLHFYARTNTQDSNESGSQKGTPHQKSSVSKIVALLLGSYNPSCLRRNNNSYDSMDSVRAPRDFLIMTPDSWKKNEISDEKQEKSWSFRWFFQSNKKLNKTVELSNIAADGSKMGNRP